MSFYGKYRGKVTENVDPLNLGRVQVEVPAVLGSGREGWALPCTPYAGPQVGFFAIPPVGANVWVEFEGGDPDYPIWAGCFWGEGEVPLEPAVPEKKVFKIEGITLTMNGIEGEGGFSLEVTAPIVEEPMTLTMTEAGIELKNGTQTKVLMTLEEIQASNGETTTMTMTADAVTINVEELSAAISSAEGQIKLDTGASSATLTEEEISLLLGSAAVKLSEAGINLTLAANAVNITEEGVEASAAPSTLNVTPEAIEAGSASASVTVAAEAIALSNGAGNVDITPASVSINEGALEII